MARPTKQEQRTKQAKDLHESDVLKEIFRQREADIVGAWKSSGSAEQRETHHSDIKALGRLKEYIYAAASGN